MGTLQRLRRRLLTPDVSQTDLKVRGFHIKSTEARQRLETVGRSFLEGFGHAAEASHPLDAETPLEHIDRAVRGFAYEGAAMGLAVRDGLPVGGRRHVEDFLTGRAADHVYMVYVGVGWAMARLPRMRWNTLYTADPLLRWLVLDGYGFHQAYFKTSRYVHEQYREQRPSWPLPGPAWHACQVVDQGVGRACWFVGGTDPDVVARLLSRFSEERLADLWSGVGLAATYAGGADLAELEHLRELAGVYQPQLAQGSAFGVVARLRAGLLVPHNELAVQALCGVGPVEAQKITDEALAGLNHDGDVPSYAIWRQRVAHALR